MLIRVIVWAGLLLTALTPACAQQVEAAFSPDKKAVELVQGTISSARQSIEVSAYMLTSAPIVKALITADKRGVRVRVVADGRGNSSRASKAALNALALAGVEVRLNRNYAIHHDKFMVIDGKTVQTGSFNYTAAAATKNSENVIVIKEAPAVAQQYRGHWQKRFGEAEQYKVDLSN